MALPRPLRNRLAELILDAFEEDDARRTLRALAAFCLDPERPLDEEATARLDRLGWFQRAADGGLRLAGAYRAHGAALGRRVAAAAGLFPAGAPPPEERTLAGLLARARALAEGGLFFEVHELLEPAWMRADGDERTALQGLIQVAVALHHVENGNRAGARSLLAEGLAKLSAAGGVLPLDVPALVEELRAVQVALDAGTAPPPSRWPAPRAVPPSPRPAVPR